MNRQCARSILLITLLASFGCSARRLDFSREIAERRLAFHAYDLHSILFVEYFNRQMVRSGETLAPFTAHLIEANRALARYFYWMRILQAEGSKSVDHQEAKRRALEESEACLQILERVARAYRARHEAIQQLP